MILTYNGPQDRMRYDKIGAIKAIRNHTGIGLKEAKEAVEKAVEEGTVELYRVAHKAPPINTINFNNEMKSLGAFSVVSSLTELTNTIERAIEIAVNLREYKTARALINTLPREMRSHMGDIADDFNGPIGSTEQE